MAFSPHVARCPRLALATAWVLALLGPITLLECAYRGDWIDFHAGELRAANSSADLTPDGRPVLLVLGDSFSADPRGYVPGLRRRLPDWRVVNSGVSGFSASQLLRLAPRRLRQSAPRVVVVQLYVGNDLLETRHPRGRVGRWRSLYWGALDAGWSSLGWLNYAAGQAHAALMRAWSDAPDEPARARLEARAFAPELFTPRERVLLAADADQPRAAVLLERAQWPAFERYVGDLRALLRLVRASGAQPRVLVIPHAVQVHARYRARFEQLGARLGDPALLAAPEAPFVRTLRARLEAPVLDPLPAFQAAEVRGQVLYRNNDVHLTPEGQALVADLLVDSSCACPRVPDSPP